MMLWRRPGRCTDLSSRGRQPWRQQPVIARPKAVAIHVDAPSRMATVLRASPELHRRGQCEPNPAGEHPVLAEQLVDLRQHQRCREGSVTDTGSVARLTSARTSPGMRSHAFSMHETHDAQGMPSMGRLQSSRTPGLGMGAHGQPSWCAAWGGGPLARYWRCVCRSGLPVGWLSPCLFPGAVLRVSAPRSYGDRQRVGLDWGVAWHQPRARAGPMHASPSPVDHQWIPQGDFNEPQDA